MKTETVKKKLGIYIHIPFCVQKCLYCDFCSFTGKGSDVMERYVVRLCREIESCSEKCRDYSVDTVYFGGGTPTLLPISLFERLMLSVRGSFSLADDAEISCECNPATADKSYFFALRSFGVNRLCVGLQSVHAGELSALGRIHSFDDFVKTYSDARNAGFDNISTDLMYGIPNQTLDTFRLSLETLVSMSPTHISAYGLKIEEGTPFYKKKDSLVLPDEDTEYGMYMLCSQLLAKYGYEKYEISNFAHKGYESRHNIKYWMGEPYIGLGVAAHSFFEGVRFANSRDITGYIGGKDITEERRTIDFDEAVTEFVMLRMRLGEGICKSDFCRRFGIDFDELYGKRLLRYIDRGLVVADEDSVRFSDEGFFLSNYVLSDILDF